MHLSIDDCILIFKDLTENEEQYDTIFDNKTLKYLKRVHELYGAKFSLYCFYDFSNFNLSNATSKFEKEFIKNSSWLKFGYHALNCEKDYTKTSYEEVKKDYETCINELKRIVGEESIESVIRLEKFKANEQTVLALRDLGIVGLLGADTDDRENYYLSEEKNQELFKSDYIYDENLNIFIYKTDLRIERIDNFNENINDCVNDNNLIIFTHEWQLKGKTKYYLEKICKWSIMNGYTFEFPEKK